MYEYVSVKAIILFLAGSILFFLASFILFVIRSDEKGKFKNFFIGISVAIILAIIHGFIQKFVDFLSFATGIFTGLVLSIILFPTKQIYARVLYNLLISWQVNLENSVNKKLEGEINKLDIK